jgi:DNA modification methylase
MQELLNTIILGKWEDWLPKLPDNSIDMALLDPPYNTTACEWDKQPVDLAALWKELKRVGKDRTAYVFTASQPFTTHLIMSNLTWFKYCWVWEKTKPSDHVNAKNNRQREIEADGWRFLRFGGKEIYHDAEKCAHEALNFITKLSQH